MTARKIGRPRLEAEDARQKSLTMRLSAQEMAVIRDAASRAGLGLAGYVRTRMLEIAEEEVCDE